MELLFWGSIAGLGWTYAGYPLLMRLLGWVRREPPAVEGEWPGVTAVVVAHNEEGRIRARVKDLLGSDYPGELRVLVVSDGSTDGTVREAKGARVLELPVRGGKAAGLNAALAMVETPVVVFTDARQCFAPETVRVLVGWLRRRGIGAVSGALEIAAAGSGMGGGLGAYWEMEKGLRAAEARWDSCIGCTGAVYAIWRELWRALPEDTLLDDVVTPMEIAAQGWRVWHAPEARAYDPQPLEPAAEQRRKRRTLAGNFQMLFRYPQWLWGHRLWWQLISHKYCRLAAPVWLAATLVSSAGLARRPFFAAVLAAQIAAYGLALVSLAGPRWRSPVFTIPGAFLFLNWSVVTAFVRYWRRGRGGAWEK